jgi:hypothetical protein
MPYTCAVRKALRCERRARRCVTQVSNVILWFTYVKAVVNTFLASIGVKTALIFKATDKTSSGAQAAQPAGLLQAVSRRLPALWGRQPRQQGGNALTLPTQPTVPEEKQEEEVTLLDQREAPPRPCFGVSGACRAGARQRSRRRSCCAAAADACSDSAYSLAPAGAEAKAKPGAEAVATRTGTSSDSFKRFARVFRASNLVDMGGVLDPLALVLLFLFSVLSLGMGIYRCAPACL